jgi:hypothetical protein
VIGMADDRIGSGRNEYEGGTQKRSYTEDVPTSNGSIGGQFSRSQRLGGNAQPSVTKVVDLSKKNSGRKSIPEEHDDDGENENRFPRWARVTLWLLRKSIVPIIMIVMLIVGLYGGYVFLGDGPKGDVFKWETWRHLYDLIFAES